MCNSLQRSLRNIWIRVVHVYLSQSRYVIIVGGTSDYSTVLSSVDIYDSIIVCYNISNMIYPRMKCYLYYVESKTVNATTSMQQ